MFGGQSCRTQLAPEPGQSGARGLHAMSVFDPRRAGPGSQQVPSGPHTALVTSLELRKQFRASVMGSGLVFTASLWPDGRPCSATGAGELCVVIAGTHKWGCRVLGVMFHRKDPDSAKLSPAEPFHLLIKHVASIGLALKQMGEQTLLTIFKKA